MASSNPPPSAPIYFDPSTMIEQNWSLPESIIYYIAKNPTSMAVYQKLIRTCKYFFYKNPIITVASLKYSEKREEETDDSDDDAEMGESEDDDSDLNDEDMEEDGELEHDSDGNDDVAENINNEDAVNAGVNVAKAEEQKKWRACLECDCEEDGCCLEIDDLKTFNRKIWVSSDLEIDGFNEIHTELIPKLASYEFNRFSLDNLEIGFDDFALLSQSATVVWLMGVKVTYNDGKVVPLEDILDCIPNIRTLTYKFPADASSNSSKTGASLFKCSRLKFAFLFAIPEAFDIEAFCGAIDKKKKFAFTMCFSKDISDAYKLKLDNFVDTVINQYRTFGLLITYPGQDMVKQKLLNERFIEVV